VFTVAIKRGGGKSWWVSLDHSLRHIFGDGIIGPMMKERAEMVCMAYTNRLKPQLRDVLGMTSLRREWARFVPMDEETFMTFWTLLAELSEREKIHPVTWLMMTPCRIGELYAEAEQLTLLREIAG
jgi:hypothetical protein